MNKVLTLIKGTIRSVYSKTWLEPELKKYVQDLAEDRGMKESPLIRWLIIRGINSIPDHQIIEND